MCQHILIANEYNKKEQQENFTCVFNKLGESQQVIKKSNGNQVPTSREENVKNDFRLY